MAAPSRSAPRRNRTSKPAPDATMPAPSPARPAALSPAPVETLADRAERVRRFNRFYTRRIGVLRPQGSGRGCSLTEARVLYELSHRSGLTTSRLCRELDLDAGYLSRIIGRFERLGWVVKTRSAGDGRVIHLALTREGKAAYRPLNTAARRQGMAMLAALPVVAQEQLVAAMAEIESLLGPGQAGLAGPGGWPGGRPGEVDGADDGPGSPGATPAFILRDPRPGDLGWIISRQTLIYAREYGWNGDYEALVAEILARYVRDFRPGRERAWIAERHGRIVGSVFVVREDEETARLRLLYVEPTARGLGIGHRLVDECLGFARDAGYRRMVLWTNSVLVDARRIYEGVGFRLIDEAPHQSFGQDLVGQTWARSL